MCDEMGGSGTNHMLGVDIQNRESVSENGAIQTASVGVIFSLSKSCLRCASKASREVILRPPALDVGSGFVGSMFCAILQLGDHHPMGYTCNLPTWMNTAAQNVHDNTNVSTRVQAADRVSNIEVWYESSVEPTNPGMVFRYGCRSQIMNTCAGTLQTICADRGLRYISSHLKAVRVVIFPDGFAAKFGRWGFGCDAGEGIPVRRLGD